MGASIREPFDLPKWDHIAYSGFQPQLCHLRSHGRGRVWMVQRKLVGSSPQDNGNNQSQQTNRYGTLPFFRVIGTHQTAATIEGGHSRLRE